MQYQSSELFFSAGVVYFDKHLDGTHAKRWSKYVFFTFSHENLKKEKERKKNEAKKCYLGLNPNAGRGFYSQKKACFYNLFLLGIAQLCVSKNLENILT